MTKRKYHPPSAIHDLILLNFFLACSYINKSYIPTDCINNAGDDDDDNDVGAAGELATTRMLKRS